MSSRPTMTIAVGLLLTLGLLRAHAEDKSRSMGGAVTLKKAPNGVEDQQSVSDTISNKESVTYFERERTER